VITGYFIRGSNRESADWALIEMDGSYRETVVVDGLAYDDAVALYWETLATLQKQLSSPVSEQSGDDAPAPRAPTKQQLTFKF
jgi:hypothetical protein